MKAFYSISPDHPKNEQNFNDDFFKRFSSQKTSYALDLDGIKKTYTFPTLYNDVSCAIGIFFCDYAAACKIMPHKKMFPVKMLNDQALVIFSCYEYRQVCGLWPYNEIAMAIPVMFNSNFNIPILPIFLNSLFHSFGYYVFLMPVTSKENQIRGNKIWGLPKITQRIDMQVQNDEFVTTVYEMDGIPYFTLCVPIKGKISDIDSYSYIYSKLDEKIKKSKTCYKGRYAINNNLKALWQKNSFLNKECLKIGNSQSANILHALKINPIPFQFRYTKSMNASFGLPDTLLDA